MCCICELFRWCCSRKKKANDDLFQIQSLGSDQSKSDTQDRRQIIYQTSSPSHLLTTDLTRVYDLPDEEYKDFKSDNDVIKSNGFEVMYNTVLGKGSYASVFMAKRLRDQSTVACKVMDVSDSGFSSKLNVEVKNELFVMEKTTHPHIVTLFTHFIVKNRLENTTKVYLFLKFAENNSLSYQIRHMVIGFNEPTAKRMFAQIVSAIHYMHGLGITHRDLKMGNILLDKDMNAMVSDFGLSYVAFRESKGGTIMSDHYTGTLPYMAPEIVMVKIRERHEYDPFPADVWALGVILHTMINKAYPFGDKDPHLILKRQLRFQTLSNSLNRYTKSSKDYENLIRRLLTYESEQRISILELIEHNWIKSEIQKINEKIEALNQTIS